MEPDFDEPSQVEIEPWLEPHVAGYLERRKGEIDRMRALLAQRDFAALRVVGHNLKGSGGGFGLQAITSIGREIERAAVDKNAKRAAEWIAELEEYVGRVRVRVR